jgi:putative endonuclease
MARPTNRHIFSVHLSLTPTFFPSTISYCHPERSEGPMQRRDHHYFVYILTNHSKTLYVGVTNNLRRRVWEHKSGNGSEFCKRYKIERLVYYESFDDVRNAIDREKRIKGWLRIKKIQLIVSMNPAWRDLSEGGTNGISSSRRVHRSFAALRMTRVKIMDDGDGRQTKTDG